MNRVDRMAFASDCPQLKSGLPKDTDVGLILATQVIMGSHGCRRPEEIKSVF